MGSYHQLNYEEREKIYLEISQGISLRQIARNLGRSHTTITREVRRNSDKEHGYLPSKAQTQTTSRRFNKLHKIEKDPELYEYIFKRLIEYRWSPEQISGRMKLEKQNFYTCKESIYRYIYKPGIVEQKLYLHLPKKKKKRTSPYKRPSRGGIPEATPIHQRPESIENKRYFGHFEGDLVMFGINRNCNITTLVERKTRYAIMLHNDRKYTDVVINNIANTVDKLNSENKKIVKSITFDRGTEFAMHRQLNDMGIKTFFCDPGSPQQKGANENFNGRLRRFLPKSCYTTKVTQDNVENLMNMMNNTPRKCLNFKTPQEAFQKHLS